MTFELVNEAQRAVQEAVWAEREACAEVCDAQIQECAAKVTQILKQELEALETNSSFFLDKTAKEKRAFAITALRAALAENAMQRLTDVHQEIEKTHTSVDNEYTPVKPVAWRTKNATPPGGYVVFQQYPSAVANLGGEIEPLYTAPPKRKPLTAPQIHELDWPDGVAFEDILEFTRALERAHGIGGDE